MSSAKLAKAAEARKARAELKAALKRGETNLKDVLDKAETDEIIGKTKVSALLEALPKVGKVKAKEIMEDPRLLRPVVYAASVIASAVLCSSASATANKSRDV